MSTVRIRGVLSQSEPAGASTSGNIIKSIEVPRTQLNNLTLNTIKTQFEQKFGISAINLQYRFADGRLQAAYQDFHIQEAIKDAEKTNAKYVSFSILRGGSSAAASSGASSSKSTARPTSTVMTPVTSSGTSNTSSSSTSSGATKFCDDCGISLPALAKFCSACGHKFVTSSSSTSVAPAASQRTRAGSSASGSDRSCHGCGNAITGSGVRALDATWHQECFVCNNCRKSLSTGGFVQGDDGMPLCGDCYEDNFGKKCAKCNKKITGSFLNVEGKDYHKECFVCDTCGSQFTGGYFLRNGHTLCKDCIQSH